MMEKPHCLAESAGLDLPLPSRAARAYLDVLFFHSFEDGNARAAMLVLSFVLAREGVWLDQVRPLQATCWADDAEGAADLAVLLAILITAVEGARPTRKWKGKVPSIWGKRRPCGTCRATVSTLRH